MIDLLEQETTHHEIPLDKFQLVREPFLSRICSRTLNLVVVIVEAGNMSASKLCNLARRAANTAANIKHAHAILDADVVG